MYRVSARENSLVSPTLSGEEGSVKSKSEGRQPTLSPIFPGLFLNIGSVLLPIVPALRHHLSLRYCCRSLRNCYFLIMESGIGALHRYDLVVVVNEEMKHVRNVE